MISLVVWLFWGRKRRQADRKSYDTVYRWFQEAQETCEKLRQYKELYEEYERNVRDLMEGRIAFEDAQRAYMEGMMSR